MRRLALPRTLARFLVALPLGACAAPRPPPGAPPAPPAASVERSVVELLRARPDGRKLYLPVGLPGGREAVFLLDTGGNVSALRAGIAEDIGLEPLRTGRLVGLGGVATTRVARLPWLSLGELRVDDVEVMLDLPGLPRYAEGIPIDGILGNNVLARLVVDIDLQADRMLVARPGAATAPADAVELHWDGSHPSVEAELVTTGPGGADLAARLLMEVDTGARGVFLVGEAGRPFAPVARAGRERIAGVGGPEDPPPASLLHAARRVPIERVRIGGHDLAVDLEATWLGYGAPTPPALAGVDGILGYEVFAGRRFLLDIPGRRFALLEPEGPPPGRRGQAILLERDEARYGDDPGRAALRARLLLALDRRDDAIAVLRRGVRRTGDPEATVLLARLLRWEERFDEAREVLLDLDATELVAQDELVPLVAGLLLEGRLETAWEVAARAVEAEPDLPSPWVARAHAAVAAGQWGEAHASLLAARARAGARPDLLVLGAWLAEAEGDRTGALALWRRRALERPDAPDGLWPYALAAVAAGERAHATLEADLAAIERQHPPDALPYDLLAVAWRTAGRPDRAGELARKGLERDCAATGDPPTAANCRAWYQVVGGLEGPPDPLDEVRAALEAHPHRPDFLDTLAVALEARGRLAGAVEAARRAARILPGATYPAWQLRRLERRMATASGAAP